MIPIFTGAGGIAFELEFRDYELVDGQPRDIGPVDISGSEDIVFVFLKPGGARMSVSLAAAEVALSTDGTDGKALFFTTPGFLDVRGRWKRQGLIQASTTSIFYSGVVEFLVENPI